MYLSALLIFIFLNKDIEKIKLTIPGFPLVLDGPSTPPPPQDGGLLYQWHHLWFIS